MKLLIFAFAYLFAILPLATASPDAENFQYRQNLKAESTRQLLTNQLPQKALDSLRKHKTWQTSAGFAVPGLTPVINSNRRWLVVDSNGTLELQEETKLSLVQDCVTKKYIRWESARVKIETSFDAKDFTFGSSKLCSPPTANISFNLVFMTGDRFALVPSEPGVTIIFFPVKKRFKVQSKNIMESVHIFSSPLGLNDSLGFDGLNVPKDAYLHHNLGIPMPVVLDQGFPDQFIATLKKSIFQWNKALGADFFVLRPQKEVTDPYDCLSSRKLCFLWSGPTEVSFLGVTGLTGIVFDPSSGEISGGYIGLQGTTASKNEEASPSPELNHLIDEDMTIDDVAKLFLQREELAKFLHPKPLWALGYTISHEMGHFNGLKHNFYGSHSQDGSNKTESIMDYQAFSALTSKSNKIGKLDLEAIALLYRDKVLSPDYTYCKDRDASMKGVSPDPNCNVFDLGKPDDWFIALARQAPEGVFRKHPRFDGIILDYLGAFLERGKPTVAPEQIKNVNDFLCTNYRRVQSVFDYLKANNSVDLVCE